MMHIAFWKPVGPGEKSYDPTALRKDQPLTGTHLEMIYVARGLAALGHHVSVFTQTDRSGTYDGVVWRKHEDYDPQVTYDAVIAWDDARLFDLKPSAYLRILAMQCSLQPYLKPEHNVDWFVALARGHVAQVMRSGVRANKIFVIPQSIDLSELRGRVRREKNRLIWISSPDRGLWHLLRMWPQVRERVPDAELHVYYDIEWCKTTIHQHNRWGYNVLYVMRNLEQPGVVYHGGVGRLTLLDALKRATLLPYACDPVAPTECFPHTVLEAMAAGVPCILSDADTLPELFGQHAAILPLPIDDSVWVDTIARFLAEKELWTKFSALGKEFANSYTVGLNAKRWEKFLSGKLQDKRDYSVRGVNAWDCELPEKPLVSVIIGHYDRDRDLARILRCLHRQTYDNIEVIITADGSPPQKPFLWRGKEMLLNDVIEQEGWNRVRWINFERHPSGRPQQAKLLNMAVREHAKGEMVCLLMEDWWIEDAWLEKMVRALLSFGAGNHIVGVQKNRRCEIYGGWPYKAEIARIPQPAWVDSGQCSLLYRGDWVDHDEEGFEYNLHVTQLWGDICYYAGQEIWVNSNVLMKHIRHSRNIQIWTQFGGSEPGTEIWDKSNALYNRKLQEIARGVYPLRRLKDDDRENSPGRRAPHPAFVV